MELHVSQEVGHSDGEERRTDELAECFLELHALGRPVDIEACALVVQWATEGQALDVVPVQMGHQGVRPEGPVEGLALTEEPEACAQVEDDRVGARRL